MPRGIPNKKLKQMKEDQKIINALTDGAPPKPEPVKQKIVVHPVYTPQPDMGDIRPPSDTTCNCKHDKETHYGGLKGWCNRPGCECLEFK